MSPGLGQYMLSIPCESMVIHEGGAMLEIMVRHWTFCPLALVGQNVQAENVLVQCSILGCNYVCS